MRFFNTTGPCEPRKHYMLPPLPRVPALREAIEREHYFVLHAPRQSGKTTYLRALAAALTAEGRYAAVALSVEVGVPFPEDLGRAEGAILDAWRDRVHKALPAELQPPPWPEAPAGRRFGAALSVWAQACPRPLVLLLDEIDALRDQTLLSLLRQLRSGFEDRPTGFPSSICLCGMRDVRDYKIASGGSDRLSTASPFNIKVESLTLQNFTRDEIATLYAQHTADTGQVFTDTAIDRVHALTGGQPWLVNALAAQMVDVLARDRAVPLTAEHALRAKEILIQRRDTHLDSLAERLREDRVRRVIEPLLTGADLPMEMMNDDLVYACDLGLVTGPRPVRIANAIYQEMIPRALTFIAQANLREESAWYVRPNGALDMVLVLAAFQEFFAEHSEAWLGRFDYHEAGPHLMLMAFLQRVVNGGGRIQREFALGSRRTDLLVEFGGARSAIELKIHRGASTRAEGIAQLCAYLDRLGEPEGHLVLFDRRPSIPWSRKLFIEEAAGPAGQRVFVYGA